MRGKWLLLMAVVGGVWCGLAQGEDWADFRGKEGGLFGLDRSSTIRYPAAIAFNMRYNLSVDYSLVTRIVAGCQKETYYVTAFAVWKSGTPYNQILKQLDDEGSQQYPSLPIIENHEFTDPHGPELMRLRRDMCAEPPVAKYDTDTNIAVGLTTGTTPELIFVKVGTIKDTGGMREVWTSNVPSVTKPVMVKGADGQPHESYFDGVPQTKTIVTGTATSKTKYQIQCREWKFRQVARIEYQLDGQGNSSDYSSTPLEPIVPDTVGEVVAKFVCGL